MSLASYQACQRPPRRYGFRVKLSGAPHEVGPCAACGDPKGYERGGNVIRSDGRPFGFKGAVCSTCARRLRWKLRRAEADELKPDTDGLLGETEAERAEIKANIAEVFATSVLPRYLNQRAVPTARRLV